MNDNICQQLGRGFDYLDSLHKIKNKLINE